MKAIILAAGVGKRLQEKGKEIPKCFIEIAGKKLIDRYMDSLIECGIKDVVFVVGYKADLIKDYLLSNYKNVNLYFELNEGFTKGNIISAYMARSHFDNPFILMDADVAFPVELFKKLVSSDKRDCLLLDTGFNNDDEEMKLGAENGRVLEINRTLTEDYPIQGEGVGFFKCSTATGNIFRSIMKDYIDNGEEMLEYETALNDTMKKAEIGYELVDGLPWTEIDFTGDLEKAKALFE